MFAIRRLRSSMAVNIIGATVFLLLLFGLIVSLAGYFSFTNAFVREYNTTTSHMASTAATLVNGDHIDHYLRRTEISEYMTTKIYMDSYCKEIGVSLVYVIKVDQSDYGRFVSIFNAVDNSVDDTEYSPWELGHKRDTTNDEYRAKYKAIYEEGSDYETIYRTKVTGSLHPHITAMVPIRNYAGNVTAILCMQRPIRELTESRRPYIINIAVLTVLLSVFASLVIAQYLKRFFVRPIQAVSDEASRFARENTRGTGSLSGISTFDEVVRLADSIETMEEDMLNYIGNLTNVTAERERIGTELELASRIQTASIPNSFPAFPDRTEFEVYAQMDPARQVGGDFYNFFLIDDDHLAVMIGDVSGKGVPASLFMMVTNILVSERTRAGGATPAEILAYLNNRLCQRNRAEMFVTLWLGILDIPTGRLTAANAGHEYPVIAHAGGKYEILKDKHGFVIGGMDGMKYKDYEVMLEPGSRLFVYTDGVPEATDPDEELFGMERTLETLNADPSASPEQVLKNIRAAVDAFVRDAEQFDDLTMLSLEYRGPGAGKEERA